jgi:predicted AlkP superfamily pyrophosphatase or phosphodiesterase
MTTTRGFSFQGLCATALIASLVAGCGGTGDSPNTRSEASSAPSAPRVPKVLVIGIDGVRPDVLAEVSTPNIDALAKTGTFSDRARTGFPSVSGPGWSSFLIGVWPEKHGVTDNEFGNKHYDQYPDFLTRIEQVRPELSTFAVADWLPLVSSDHNGPVISDAVDVRHVLDGYELGWPQADERSVDLAVEALGSTDPDALFVYLGNPDETSHQNASIGAEYRAALEEADRQVGRLVQAMRARATYADEDWLIVMSTDHGRRADGGHGGDTPEERTTFFLVSGSSASVGAPTAPPNVVDVAVTALVHLGIEIDPAWGLDGRSVGIDR